MFKNMCDKAKEEQAEELETDIECQDCKYGICLIHTIKKEQQKLK